MDDECSEESKSEGSDLDDPRLGRAVAFLICLTSAATVAAWPLLLKATDEAWLLRVFTALLVSCPAWLVLALALRLDRVRKRAKCGFRLHIGAPLPRFASPMDGGHAVGDEVRWRRVLDAAKKTWDDERDRVVYCLRHVSLLASLWAALTTVSLSICSVTLQVEVQGFGLNVADANWVALAVLAATCTAFLMSYIRVSLRVTQGDVTSRMFAWASRSVVLGVVAAFLLSLLMLPADGTGSVGCLILGVLAGLMGEKAVLLAANKAALVFNLTAPEVPVESALASIEGITDEHVERLKEEGIRSLHDLAFVPTARLFFASAYSLQQICNWQDRALLRVYVGPECANNLATHMQIRGAIDLLACAHDCRYDPEQSRWRRRELAKACALEDGGLDQLIASMAHDEVTMRLGLYWRSAPVENASQRPSEQVELTVSDVRELVYVDAS